MRYFWGTIAIIVAVILFLTFTGSISWQRQTPDNLASIVYYALLGLLLCSSLLSMRISLRHAMRSILVWMALFFILIIGYANRYDLQNLTSQLTAGIIPANPITRQREDGQTVTLERMRNGHFETRAQIDGTPIQLMIDTGASSIVLSYEDAQRIGIHMQNLRFTIPVSTANGQTLSAATILDEIKVGGITRRNLSAMIAQRNALDGSLLGMSFLNRLSGYSVRGDRMMLID